MPKEKRKQPTPIYSVPTTKKISKTKKPVATVHETIEEEENDEESYNCCGCIPADQGIFALSLLIFMLTSVLVYFSSDVSNFLSGLQYTFLLLLFGLALLFSGLVLLAICLNKSELFIPVLIVGLISDIYNLIALGMLIYVAFFWSDKDFDQWFQEHGEKKTHLVKQLTGGQVQEKRTSLKYSCVVQFAIFVAEVYLVHTVHTAYEYVKKREQSKRLHTEKTAIASEY